MLMSAVLGNIQGGGRKFLGYFIRHFRSQIESSKQGRHHMTLDSQMLSVAKHQCGQVV